MSLFVGFDTKARQALVDWIAVDRRARSQIRIAGWMGLSQPAISAWVRGTARPEPDHRIYLEILTGGEVAAVDWSLPSETEGLQRGRLLLTGTCG